jgi:nitric oxide reductase activation protein
MTFDTTPRAATHATNRSADGAIDRAADGTAQDNAHRAAARRTRLQHLLRLLWNRAPALHLDAESPHIAAGEIHLVAQADWALHAASAAHAAAHLVYSPARFDADDLGPIARALVALLEDARVEALAGRELPGLARLWRTRHLATPESGRDFEALMQRLARALADPRYDDPDPWVRKGRALFFLDAPLGLLALRSADDVRRAALRLGHDIGQMRLPFNAKSHRPAPDYRDDHRWMWSADAAEPPAQASVRMLPSREQNRWTEQSRQDDPVPAPTATSHPEWDRLIARLRPNWCRVIEQPASEPEDPDAATNDTGTTWSIRHRLGALVRRMTRAEPVGRSADPRGDFDLDALLAWCVGRRVGHAGDPRVFRSTIRRRTRHAAWLLVDASASSEMSIGSRGRTLLDSTREATLALAAELQTVGAEVTIVAFRSMGRQQVILDVVKDAAEPLTDDRWRRRLHALRPQGSTRLGAAVRHATLRLRHRGSPGRSIVVLSDVDPYDIDVHDGRYLVDDARHAVREAARKGVRVACVLIADLPSRGPAQARAVRIFGHGV